MSRNIMWWEIRKNCTLISLPGDNRTCEMIPANITLERKLVFIAVDFIFAWIWRQKQTKQFTFKQHNIKVKLYMMLNHTIKRFITLKQTSTEKKKRHLQHGMLPTHDTLSKSLVHLKKWFQELGKKLTGHWFLKEEKSCPLQNKWSDDQWNKTLIVHRDIVN